MNGEFIDAFTLGNSLYRLYHGDAGARDRG